MLTRFAAAVPRAIARDHARRARKPRAVRVNISAVTANRVRNAAAPRAVRVKISAITANRVRNAAAPRAVRVNISAISANRVRNAATFSSYSTYFNFVAYFENRFPGSCYRSVLILAC